MNEDLIYYPDYQPNADQDDDHIFHIKEAVDRLDFVSKKVFLSYCELGTIAATARLFGVSNTTMSKYLQSIKQKIYNNL